MTETKELTPAELQPLLADIVARMPNTVNPTEAGACLYTHSTQRDWHCLIGQLASEQGWKMPEDLGCTAEMEAGTLDWPVTSDGAWYLTLVQEYADSGANPIPWGTVPLDIRSDLV